MGIGVDTQRLWTDLDMNHAYQHNCVLRLQRQRSCKSIISRSLSSCCDTFLGCPGCPLVRQCPHCWLGAPHSHPKVGEGSGKPTATPALATIYRQLAVETRSPKNMLVTFIIPGKSRRKWALNNCEHADQAVFAAMFGRKPRHSLVHPIAGHNGFHDIYMSHNEPPKHIMAKLFTCILAQMEETCKCV